MRAPAMLVCAALIASACGFGGSMTTIPSMSCENVPNGACDEQAQIVTAGMTGVSEVILQCRAAPPCTRAGGAGMAEIRFQNGQKLNRAWSYTGDPAQPVVTCVGIDRQLCLQYVQGEIDNVAPSKHITGIDATCTSATCTAADGELKVTISLGDGSRQEVMTGWSGGP